MNKSKILSFVLSGLMAVTAMGGLTINAEEQVTADTTTATEETTQAVKQTIVAELTAYDEWTGGDFTKTIDLSSFGYDFGDFTSLMINETAIDSLNYSVSQSGNENITFTISEAFMNTLTNDKNYFTVDFENVTIQNGFAVTISETAEDTSETQPTAAETENVKTDSPKTSDRGTGALITLLALSAATAVAFRKRK